MPDALMLLLLFLLTVVLVYGVRHYALRFLLDTPNHRSAHQLPTPRGGGLACVLAFVVAAVYLFAINRLLLHELGLVAIGLIVAGVGFWDDHRHVPARWRLLAHFCAALLVMLCLQGLPTVPLPFAFGELDLGWSGYLLGLLFLVWVLNLFNFMDGADGIAASEALFVSAGLAGFMWGINVNLALLALSLAVVCLGFLVWNWPPAKIFMGDVGSSFIGFMLGVLILLFSHTNSLFGIMGLILFAVFVVDASVTLFRRVLTGHKCYEAHCDHAYQRLVRRYQPNGHFRVVTGMTLINIGYLLPLATIAFKVPNYAWMCLMLAYIPLIVLAYLFKAGSQSFNG